MKSIVAFVLFFSCVCLVGKGWHYLKDGFKFERIYRPFSANCENAGLADDIVRRALNQPYFYLGRGRQCFAFESEDGKYVLKLPRLDHFELPFWARAFPFRSLLEKYKEKQLAGIETRRDFLVESFRIAFHQLKEETGLLYVHLRPTDDLGVKTVLVDRVHNSYRIDLDKVSFALQEKKELLMSAFRKSLGAGDRKRAKEILNAFLELVALRSEKEVFNKDASFLRNFGIEGNKAMQIDIGSFYRKEVQKDPFLHSFRDTALPVEQWLGSIDPEMQEWFKIRSEEICANR